MGGSRLTVVGAVGLGQSRRCSPELENITTGMLVKATKDGSKGGGRGP